MRTIKFKPKNELGFFVQSNNGYFVSWLKVIINWNPFGAINRSDGTLRSSVRLKLTEKFKGTFVSTFNFIDV